MNAIDTLQLSRRYGRTDAVNGLDLAVPENSVYALIGPNGAGKTTTIKILMNLLAPTGGSARVLGVDSRRLGPAELSRIGYVSENQNLPLWMTTEQLVAYCRPLYPSWDRDLESSLMRQFELPMNRPLRHLSRGLLMKVALLVSLAYRPKLLILDEPFSGLDPLARDEFVSGLLEASQAGEWTVLVSSHDIEEVERLCDWIGMIEGGRLRYSESTEVLLTRFRSVEISGSAQGSAPPVMVPTWLGQERSEGLARFIESDYRGEESERFYRENFPGAAVLVRPMTLREILVAQARAARQARKGVAA